MPERHYIQHGSRHRPTGSDPIPDLSAGGTNLPMGSLRTSGRSVSGDNAQHYISMQDGFSSTHFQTNDSSVFANASTTAFTGSAVYGLQAKAAGMYRLDWNVFVSGGTGGVQLVVYQSTENGTLSNYQAGRTGAAIGDTWDFDQAGGGPHLFWTEYNAFSSGQVPSVSAPWAQLVSGSACTLVIQLIMTMLNDFNFNNT